MALRSLPLLRRLFTLACLAVLFTLAQPAAAETVPVDDYWPRVAALAAQVRGLAGQPLDAQRAALAAAASSWDAVTAVTLPDGTVVPLDHSALTAALRAETPDLDRLAARLDALVAAQAAWPAARHTTADVQRLQAVLARVEFQWAEPAPDPLAELIDRAWRFLLRLLERLLPEGAVTGTGADLFGWAFTILSVLVVGGLLAYAARGLFGGLVREVTLPPDAALEAGALSADDAAQRAQVLAGQGDYRTAVRYLYLSALLSLELRGLLRYERTLTNHEVLRRLSAHPELAAPMQAMVAVFDRVWYGFEALDANGYAAYAASVAALRQARG